MRTGSSRSGGRGTSRRSARTRVLAASSSVDALEHDLQHLFLARPSLGPPPLILDRPGARAPVAAASIGDDDDVVTSLEHSTQPFLEMAVRSADDQEHPPG